jgi:hypothetical protein
VKYVEIPVVSLPTAVFLEEPTVVYDVRCIAEGISEGGCTILKFMS